MTLEKYPVIFDDSEPIKLTEGTTIFGIKPSSLKPVIESSLQASFPNLKISYDKLVATIGDRDVCLCGDVVATDGDFNQKVFHVNNVFNNGPSEILVRNTNKSYSTHTDPGGSLNPQDINALQEKFDDLDSVLVIPIINSIGKYQTLTEVKTWIEKVDGENIVLIQVGIEEENPRLLIENGNHKEPKLIIYPVGRDEVEIPLDHENFDELLLLLFEAELYSEKIRNNLPIKSKVQVSHAESGKYFNFKFYKDFKNGFGEWSTFLVVNQRNIGSKLSMVESDDESSNYAFSDLVLENNQAILKLKKKS